MSSSVLDASAALAYLQGEPGADRVSRELGTGALMSTVNLAEVATKLAADGLDEAAIRAAFNVLQVTPEWFDEAEALSTGLLRPATRAFGLSLGDRACLALALQRGLPVLTTDRAWRDIAGPLNVDIEVIR